MTNQADKPSPAVQKILDRHAATLPAVRMVWALRSALRDDSSAARSRDTFNAASKAEADLIAEIERLASQSAAAPPIAPVAWRFKDMAGNVHYAESVTPLAQSDITPLYAAPPSAVLLEVMEALKRSNEWLATYPGGGTLSPTGPYEQGRAAIAKLRDWMGEKEQPK